MTPLWFILITCVAIVWFTLGYAACLIRPHVEKRLQQRVVRPTVPLPKNVTPLRTV